MHRSSERGSILVLLLLLITVLSLLGVWALSSTRSASLKAGSHRGTTKLSYSAEEAFHKAVDRIRAIADPALTDPLKADGLYTGPEKEISWLVGTSEICPGIECDAYNPACPEPFDPAVDLDVGMFEPGFSNVICNFMGNALPDTQVILNRRSDWIEGTQRSAVFLLVTISRDESARRRIVYGVVIVPYDGSYPDFSMPTNYRPYIATMLSTREG